MIKHVALLMLLGLAVIIWTPQLASAHVLQADGDIGAIMHIYPDDNPITGRSVEYMLSFQDITKRFSLYDCDCQVSYVIDERTVATEKLTTSTTTDSLNTFTFPEAAVYQIQVSGKPTVPNSFQAFDFAYTVRVASGDIQAQQMPAVLWLGIATAIGLVLLAAYAMDDNNQTTKK